jgi:hypothetical protein
MIYFLQLLYPPKPMKRKIQNIVDEIKFIVNPICKEKFGIECFGAYDVNPEYLVIWICVESDECKLKLESNTELHNRLRNTLVKHDYPYEAISSVHIGFESQETVNRESNGNWYEHFK